MDKRPNVEPYGASHGIADPYSIGIAYNESDVGSQQEANDLCAIRFADAIAQHKANDFGAYFYSYKNTNQLFDRISIAHRSVGRSFLGGGGPVRSPSSIFHQQ